MERLKTLGHRVTSVPLFRTIFEELDDICLQNVSVVIFTSANSARALLNWLEQRQDSKIEKSLNSKTCFAIGDHTAEIADQLGFRDVYTGDADAAALLKTVQAKTNPTEDHLLHIRGAEISMDFAKPLKNAGYVFTEKIAYRMQTRTEAAGELRNIFSTTTQSIDIITFFSAKTAEQFVNLIGANKLEPQLENVKALCLSEKISAEIRSLPFRDITVSAKPNINALIETLVE